MPRNTSLVVLAAALMFVVALSAFAVAADSPTNKQLTNSLGMKFTTIPAGEFLMGATPEEIAERREQLIKRSGDDDNALEIRKQELAWLESEGPQHRVTISKNYLLGAYEVTQSEFQSVMGFNPSDHAATGGRARIMAGIDTRRHPVEKVSWHDAVEFCRQLSSLAEEVTAGRSYRLPTEAEWEYAYRAGTTTKFYWGDDPTPAIRERLNYKKLSTYKKATPVPVGSIEPNPWGLYDMAGNVREWSADWYDVKTYTKAPVRDPAGPASGAEHVTRGAMSYYFPPNMRSATRRSYAPDTVNTFIGFRVVCIPGEVSKIVQTAAAPPQIEAQLRQKGLVRQGTLFVLVEEANFARYTTALERMRVACFIARREVDDAKKQLQRVSATQAGALAARVEARNMMRYSDTWREHRNGVIMRNMAADALALSNMSREDIESWLADAQADYDTALSRFAAQCRTLRETHDRLQTKQREIAADSEVRQTLASASAGGKTSYRLGTSPATTASLKKLEHEESVVKQLQGG